MSFAISVHQLSTLWHDWVVANQHMLCPLLYINSTSHEIFTWLWCDCVVFSGLSFSYIVIPCIFMRFIWVYPSGMIHWYWAIDQILPSTKCQWSNLDRIWVKFVKPIPQQSPKFGIGCDLLSKILSYHYSQVEMGFKKLYSSYFQTLTGWYLFTANTIDSRKNSVNTLYVSFPHQDRLSVYWSTYVTFFSIQNIAQSIQYAYSLLWSVLFGWYCCALHFQDIYFPTFFRIALLPLEPAYDCPVPAK